MLQSPADQLLYAPLQQVDPEIHELIEHERQRQFRGLELIASENYTSVSVMEVSGSILTNKYSEGLPGARYYGGNEYIDAIERLCQQRALAAFNLDPAEWGVNVQPHSGKEKAANGLGSQANFAAYTGILSPQDRIMGLDLPSGGHLTHGYQTAKKKVSATSVYFQSLPYQVDPSTGLVDYDQLARNAKLFHPRLIICGGSAYPREWDYSKLRAIADEEGAWLMADMAHVSGLVAAGEAVSPFQWCDLVTSTTHKTLRGPRSGLIFYRRSKAGLEERINQAVFPGCQGGPHDHTIGALAVALKQVATPAFKHYAQRVRANAQVLAKFLLEQGYTLCTGGTDNHLLLWDLRPQGITGSKMERLCEMISISINKNSLPGDPNAVVPGGVRIGTPALTTRGCDGEAWRQVGMYLHQAVLLCQRIQAACGSKMLKDFVAYAEQDPEVKQLREQVETFAQSFPMPGAPKL